MPATAPPPLLIRPISPLPDDQEIEVLTLDATSRHTVVIGRTSAADWTVPHLSISRRHAAVERRADEWLLADLGSRHGTFINGQRLAESEKLPLRPGDEIRLGAWACRCDAPHAPTSRLTSIINDPPAARLQVQRISAANLGGVAQQRLDALIDASRELEHATDRAQVAATLVRCAAAGSGCATVVVVRPAGDGQYEQLAPAEADGQIPLSRTLLEAAAEGEVVLLSGGAGKYSGAQSIIDLGIRSALCAPLMLEGALDCLLYLDTRSSGPTLSDDIATFCRALAQLGASAIERQLARELAARRQQLERDLDSARRAQQLLMPPRSGTSPHLSYCFESIPGRYVAGDFFDVVELPDRRTAFFLGDVSGKGAAASLLMAAAQTHLRTLLAAGVALAEAVESLNAFVHSRTETRTFITVIAGVFAPISGTLDLVDAGHGLFCITGAGSPPRRLEIPGGLPVGVDPDIRYPTGSLPVRPGERLIMFSDGLLEQTNPEGAQFGFDGTLAALAHSNEPEQDVRSLVSQVTAHAAGLLADDLTVVSLRFCPEP